MRIHIMRDIIKYSSLASCDSHTFPSEFQPDAGFFCEPRRLSNITECHVQCEQATFEWGSPLNGQRQIVGASDANSLHRAARLRTPFNFPQKRKTLREIR